MWVRGVFVLVLCALGTVFILQGANVLHGSGMSGEGKWAVIGVLMVAVGVLVLAFSVRSRKRRSTRRG